MGCKGSRIRLPGPNVQWRPVHSSDIPGLKHGEKASPALPNQRTSLFRRNFACFIRLPQSIWHRSELSYSYALLGRTGDKPSLTNAASNFSGDRAAASVFSVKDGVEPINHKMELSAYPSKSPRGVPRRGDFAVQGNFGDAFRGGALTEIAALINPKPSRRWQQHPSKCCFGG